MLACVYAAHVTYDDFMFCFYIFFFYFSMQSCCGKTQPYAASFFLGIQKHLKEVGKEIGAEAEAEVAVAGAVEELKVIVEKLYYVYDENFFGFFFVIVFVFCLLLYTRIARYHRSISVCAYLCL